MNRPIAISLSPNVEKDDIVLALRLLFLHSNWRDAAARSRAAEMFAGRFSGHFVTLASSGRQALYDVLRSYKIGKGDEVILQAFTCIAVPEPIIWTGATPVYCDITEGSYSIDPEDIRKKITPHTKAIIIQHTFGISGPIAEVIALAKEHNLIVIEDCAHALGATHNSQALGTFGDVAIFSFGRDKCISSVFGGAVITKDKNRAHALQGMQNARQLPPKRWVAQQLLHPVLFSIILPLYFKWLGKAMLVAAQKLGFLSRAVAYEEREGKRPVHMEYAYSPALALLLIKQLEKLDRFTKRRREIATIYQQALDSHSEHSESSFLRFPMHIKNRDQVLDAARNQNMLLGDWYDAPLVPSSSNFWAFQYIPGSCPNAEAISKEILNLPTYPTLTNTQVNDVILFLKQYGNTTNTN